MATAAIDVGGPKGLRIFQDIDMAHVWGLITFTATDTYATGGIALTWQVQGFPSSFQPYHVNFFPVGGSAAYKYQLNATTGKMQIFLAAGTELTAGTVPAGVAADKVRFEAIVQRA